MKWIDYLRNSLNREKPVDGIDDATRAITLKKRMSVIWPYIHVRGRDGILWLLFLFLGFLFMFPKPLIYRYLIDNVILSRQMNMLLIVLALYSFMVISERIAETAKDYFGNLFQQHVKITIQAALFNRVLRFPQSFFDERSTGYIMSRLTEDVDHMGHFFTGYLGTIAVQMITFIAGTVMLFYLNWKVAIACMLLLPLLFLVSRFMSRRSNILSHQSMEKDAHVDAHLAESLSASKLIKSFATENDETEKLEKKMKDSLEASLEMSVFHSFAGVSVSFLSSAASLIVLLLGGYFVIRGEWTLGSLLAFQGYLGFMISPAMELSIGVVEIQSSLAALERVTDLFMCVEVEDPKGGKTVKKLDGDVEFQHVSFTYENGEEVLKDLSIKVNRGAHVALVGPSGVGKTTLLLLLLRFYQPTEGRILLDGKPIEECEVFSLRERIGYVSQNSYLLSGTILENITYGNPEAGDDEARETARKAGIHEYVESLPQGYHSRVSELGKNLSEGQKQRISIARALLKKPNIMILDEPSSSLDSLVEKSIFESLPEALNDKTLFIVAHRLSTVKHAETILVLDRGSLLDAGTHQELIERCPLYREMVENQKL